MSLLNVAFSFSDIISKIILSQLESGYGLRGLVSFFLYLGNCAAMLMKFSELEFVLRMFSNSKILFSQK